MTALPQKVLEAAPEALKLIIAAERRDVYSHAGYFNQSRIERNA
jgi:hypothetical protein